jgi:hypothetical protein
MRRACSGIIALCILLACCSSSRVVAEAQPAPSTSAAANAFALASDFPSDIVIPNIDGMRGTAFIVSAADPAGVVAVDLDAQPLALSAAFKGVVVPAGAGIPSRLLIAAADLGYLLTSNAILSFNPTDGTIWSQASIADPVEIGAGRTNSDGSAAAASLTPTYPGGIASAGDRLFVSSANYFRTQAPAAASPGTVQAFARGSDRTLSCVGAIVTSGFNPTGLAIRNGRELLVINSGVIDIVDAHGVAKTDASIDVVDLESLAIAATIPLGKIAASPWGATLTQDGARAFVGSAAAGRIYEIDLINRQVLRGEDDPIAVSAGSDYVSALALSVDDAFLFASSFETSAVLPFDLATAPYARGAPFVVGFPADVSSENPSGATTGAGPLAVRPGSRGIDYQGADLFVLTGHPGMLLAIDTGTAAQAFVPEAEETSEEEPPAPPAGVDGTPCQGFAQAVREVRYGAGAGFGQSGLPAIVLGAPRGKGSASGSTHVLSLGSGGEIILDLGSCPAVDGAGPDFIIFENAFFIGGNPAAPYAELAAVSASDDGVAFVNFPCSSAAYPYDGCAGWHPVFSNPENAISPFDAATAGGDAFDLANVGLARARFIRIVDLGLSGAAGGTAGFDLDAVAVVNGEIKN